MGPRPLYGALARLERRGLIEALEPEDRRRPYRLTGLGATTLAAQLEQLSAFARVGALATARGDWIEQADQPVPAAVAGTVRG